MLDREWIKAVPSTSVCAVLAGWRGWHQECVTGSACHRNREVIREAEGTMRMRSQSIIIGHWLLVRGGYNWIMQGIHMFAVVEVVDVAYVGVGCWWSFGWSWCSCWGLEDLMTRCSCCPFWGSRAFPTTTIPLFVQRTSGAPKSRLWSPTHGEWILPCSVRWL